MSMQNIFGEFCAFNSLGTFCILIELGNVCERNVLEEEAYGISLGDFCCNNLLQSYTNNIVLNNCVVGVEVTGGSDSSEHVGNAAILGDMYSDNTSRLKITFATGMKARQYAGLNSAGELRIWTPADLVN